MPVASLTDIDELTTALLLEADPGRVVAQLQAANLDEVLSAAPASVGLQRRWNGWYAGDDTVRSALTAREVPLTGRERRRLALEARFRSLVALVGARPGADSSAREVLDWMDERRLSWLEAEAIGPHLPSWPALKETRGALEHWRYSEIFALERVSGDAPIRGGAKQVSRSLLELLGRVLAHHYVLHLDERAFVEGLASRPADLPAAFSNFYTDATNRVLRLADSIDEPVGPLTWQGWSSVGIEGLRWRLHLDGDPVFVRLRRPPDVGLMDDCRPVLEARALGQVLQDMRDPDRCEELQLSLEAASQLGQLEPDSTLVNTDSAVELGFRIGVKAGKVTVSTLAIEVTPNGARAQKLALSDAGRMPGLTKQDRKVLRRIRAASRALGDRAALAEAVHDLVGHPWVFRSARAGAQPVSVRGADLVLSLDEERGWGSAKWELKGREFLSKQLLESLAFPVDDEQTLGVLLADDEIVVFEVMGPALAALRFLQRNEDRVPPEVVGPLLSRLEGRDDVPLTLAPSLEGRVIPGDSRAILRLEGTEMGMMVSARVQPGPDTRAYAPGEGPQSLRGRDGEGRWTVRRDLDLERRLAEQRWSKLGIVVPVSGQAEPLMLPESVALLEALQLEQDQGEVRWAGPRRHLVNATASGVRLRLQEQGRLLSLGGKIKVEGGTIDVEAVLAALRAGRRYLALDSRRIVRLHDDLAERMTALADLSWVEGDELRLSELSAPVVSALERLGATVDAPTSWAVRAAAFEQASREEPELPTGLRATLRPYQADGVRWMLRLASWGLGGVLADDMGLGKTVQALAVLLSRSSLGPAIVVAPTSVVGTWDREALKFAPDLDVRVYHGANRGGALQDLGAGQVLLTSWGTLVADADILSEIDFATVVFDEAHAIKNPSTRRAQAAWALRAGFVVALTGTPVENHPGELWSLMRAVAPGLLGSQRAFDHRFSRPIVAIPGCPQQARLAGLVRPFLLRRTKDQVAKDLPPREEVVVRVPLSAAERAVYEGVRRAGLRQLPDQEERLGAVQVLAVLTRLRQAACHTGLLVEDVGDSSKLKAVRRVLEDLRASGHKALVFSQFVSLLDVVADQLKRDGVRIARIDGRVSRTQREAAIADLQEGDAQVMLLSLQAGGVGLTLTAASYVLHLDPWWNPAVQDQATDRAHRIGQDQPVTVVHFISEETVEVGIRELQHDKRALAKGLLEGTGGAAALNTEALLQLIKDGGVPVEELPEESVTVASKWLAGREPFATE